MGDVIEDIEPSKFQAAVLEDIEAPGVHGPYAQIREAGLLADPFPGEIGNPGPELGRGLLGMSEGDYSKILV